MSNVRAANVVTLGAAIRDARKSRGWTQQQLAEAANVSRQFVLDIERGARLRAELGRVLRILRALDKDLMIVDAPPKTSFEDQLNDLIDGVS